MPGRVSLALRANRIFHADARDRRRLQDRRCSIARRDRSASACRSVRNVLSHGRETRLGNLGQLRVDDRFRGRWLVSRGFALLGEIDSKRSPAAYLASIVDGNDEASGVLVSKPAPAFPDFREVAQYRTLRFGRTKCRPNRGSNHGRDPSTRFRNRRFLRTEVPVASFFRCGRNRNCRISTECGSKTSASLAARRDRPGHRIWDQSAYKPVGSCAAIRLDAYRPDRSAARRYENRSAYARADLRYGPAGIRRS